MPAGNAVPNENAHSASPEKTTNNPLSISWFLRMNGAEV